MARTLTFVIGLLAFIFVFVFINVIGGSKAAIFAPLLLNVLALALLLLALRSFVLSSERRQTSQGTQQSIYANVKSKRHRVVVYGISTVMLLTVGYLSYQTVNAFTIETPPIPIGVKPTSTAVTVGPTQAMTPTVTTIASPTNQITATTPAPPYPPINEKLVLSDSMSKNSSSQWDNILPNNTSPGACTFSEGAYHVIVSQPKQVVCTASPTFTDFTYEVQMKILKGDQGGLVFRNNTDIGTIDKINFYYFTLSKIGVYTFGIVDSSGSAKILKSSSSSAIKSGLNQINRVAVVARGNKFEFYVNLTLILSTSDNPYSRGLVGVIAEEDNQQTEVVFSDIRVWK